MPQIPKLAVRVTAFRGTTQVGQAILYTKRELEQYVGAIENATFVFYLIRYTELEVVTSELQTALNYLQDDVAF